jgi:hypothetical protein
VRRILLLVSIGGCLSFPGSVEVSGSGVTTGLQVQSLHCSGGATLDRYAAGSGLVRITIYDGAGAATYDDHSNVTGEVDDSHDIDGAPGDWRLAVDPGAFAGQFKVTLSCL